MTTLVTGASGFLGGRLVEMLAARGVDVVVLARKTSALEHLAALPIRIAQGDLTDAESLGRAVRGVQRIFHCAACSTDWAPWNTYYGANVTGTENLLRAASTEAGLERFVHVSTVDVYGYPAVPCDESHPMVETALPYNRTKRLGELAVWEAHRITGLPVTVVRPATIYGPRGKDFTVEIATMLHQRLMLTIDHGSPRGGFAYVDNVAQAMLEAADSPAALGQAYNVADGSNATWSEYLDRYSRALGCRKPWLDLSFANAMRLARVMEVPHRALRLSGRPLLTQHAVMLLGIDSEFPISKARQEFGYAPKIGLEEGIARSAAWMRTVWATKR